MYTPYVARTMMSEPQWRRRCLRRTSVTALQRPWTYRAIVLSVRSLSSTDVLRRSGWRNSRPGNPMKTSTYFDTRLFVYSENCVFKAPSIRDRWNPREFFTILIMSYANVLIRQSLLNKHRWTISRTFFTQ